MIKTRTMLIFIIGAVLLGWLAMADTAQGQVVYYGGHHVPRPQYVGATAYYFPAPYPYSYSYTYYPTYTYVYRPYYQPYVYRNYRSGRYYVPRRGRGVIYYR